MIDYLLSLSATHWGPLRLLDSYLFLSCVGFIGASVLTAFVLPKYWGMLTVDLGRKYAVGASESVGKPLGAGIIIIGSVLLCVLIFCPINISILLILPLLALSSIIGFIDDKKEGGLSELALGIWDLLVSVLAYYALFGLGDVEVWLPFTPQTHVLGAEIAVFIFVPIIWISINALNCNDGVDGLSGALSIVSIGFISALFYVVLGHIERAEYLLVPHLPEASDWFVFSAIYIGALSSYLWFNLPPSQVLMGDAGSRPTGFVIGVLIAHSQNPFLIFVFCLMILINGATGLLKVILIRLFNFRILKNFSFPLHDHVRKTLSWSNSQVLGRFLMLHIGVTLVLVIMLLKVR